MISHILIAWDRMRWLNDPLKGRIPGFVCCCATWLTGMVIALPYPIYTIYVELGVSIHAVCWWQWGNGCGLLYKKLRDMCPTTAPPISALLLLLLLSPLLLLLLLSPPLSHSLLLDTCPDQREVIRPLKHSAAALDGHNCRL